LSIKCIKLYPNVKVYDKIIFLTFYTIKFSKILTILFGVSDENFWVSAENAGVSGKVAVGVSGSPPVMMLSSFTPRSWIQINPIPAGGVNLTPPCSFFYITQKVLV